MCNFHEAKRHAWHEDSFSLRGRGENSTNPKRKKDI
jgi:hypothetical protein